MKFKFLIPLILCVSLTYPKTVGQSLVGKWQLVHFDGIEKIKNSAQYLEGDVQLRAGIESKIKDRLENTVYQFSSPDSLFLNALIDQVVVQQKARFEVTQDQILIIILPKAVKKARILILEDRRLVLEPMGKENSIGKMIFDRIIENSAN